MKTLKSIDKLCSEGQAVKLFAPGPVQVPTFILQEMSKPNDLHRSKSYQELHSQTRSKLQRILHTENDIFFFTSSGSGVMEACVLNLIPKTGRALMLSCGNFGERWIEMATSNDRMIDVVALEWGKGFHPEKVETILSAEKQYDSIFITMNESSTGIMNPVWEIGPLVKKLQPQAVFCVDAVSCMGGREIKVDEWNIDVCLSATQKCLGVPPGLGIASVSEKALALAGRVQNRGWYFDFLNMKKYSEKDYTPATTNIPCLRALNVALEKMLTDGMENRYLHHEKMTQKIRNCVIECGFELFPEKGFQSSTITVVKNTRKVSVEDCIQKLLETTGHRFSNGYGKLSEKTFRIAAMGWITEDDLDVFLQHFRTLFTKN